MLTDITMIITIIIDTEAGRARRRPSSFVHGPATDERAWMTMWVGLLPLAWVVRKSWGGFGVGRVDFGDLGFMTELKIVTC